MEVLGIVAGADAGIVRFELAQLVGEQTPQPFERGRVRSRLARPRDVERLASPWAPVRTASPCPAQRPPEPLEVGFVTVDELDLELRRTARAIATGVDDVHDIEGDVGDPAARVGDADARASGSQRRDRFELPCRRCAASSGRSSAGGPRAAGRLDLRAGVSSARELQLPARVAVLDPPPQRDAGTGQRPDGRVVVGRREDPVLERLAVQRRRSEVGRVRASARARETISSSNPTPGHPHSSSGQRARRGADPHGGDELGDAADVDGDRLRSFPPPARLLELDVFPGLAARKITDLHAPRLAAVPHVDHVSLARLPGGRRPARSPDTHNA